MPKYIEHYGGEETSNFLRVGFLRTILLEVFLPKGYPQSVSVDYFNYQLWDTIQAFASSMNAALATEAILRGAGVGNQNASAVAATVAWLLKDGLGMITRILFTWIKSPYLDADCKQWRLFADIINDVAFSLDLITSLFADFFLPIVCLSSILRSLVAVAGVATRTTVTNHQAISNNVGDVSAKDGSQETLVNVFALVCSLLVLPLVSGQTTIIWTLFCAFTLIHLYSNYRAVRSLRFRTLNRALLSIVIRNYVREGTVCSVENANDHESIFFGDGERRLYGCRLKTNLGIDSKLRLENPKFVITYDVCTKSGFVSMARSAKVEDQLKAAIHLELLAQRRVKITDVDECDVVMCQLAEWGWSVDAHRLVFDQWTFEEK